MFYSKAPCEIVGLNTEGAGAHRAAVGPLRWATHDDGLEGAPWAAEGAGLGFEPRRGIQWENPLVNTNIGMERSIIFHGKIHCVYDYMVIFNSYVQLPEGISMEIQCHMLLVLSSRCCIGGNVVLHLCQYT